MSRFADLARRDLDAIRPWWVNLFGHANLHIGGTVARQVGDVDRLVATARDGIMAATCD